MANRRISIVLLREKRKINKEKPPKPPRVLWIFQARVTYSRQKTGSLKNILNVIRFATVLTCKKDYPINPELDGMWISCR
jgi:hypothetical protein